MNFENLNKVFKYMKLNVISIKNKLINFKNRFKQDFKEFFLVENSLNHLMKLLKWFYIISIDFDEIYYGTKNSKRLKICILLSILIWINLLHLIPFIISDYLFALMKNQILPAHLRTYYILIILFTSVIAFIKSEILINEIKFNLEPFKIFFILMNNFKAKHKLNDVNYKRLGIFSRLIIFFMVDYGVTICAILIFIYYSAMAILSKRWFWIFEATVMAPLHVIAPYTSSALCVIFIIYIYYKFRFDQINGQIKSIIPNGNWNFINKRVEKQLTNLIYEHNSLSIEIHKLNLMLNRWAAAMFIAFSTIKINALYLLFKFDNIYIKFILANFFLVFFILSFLLSYLFTLQIKSAHQSYNLINSILSKFNMKLKFRLKV